jgi:hypothetical protein
MLASRQPAIKSWQALARRPMAEGIRLAFPPSVYRKVRDRGLRMFSAFASETSRPKARHRQLEQMECLVQATGLGRSETGFRCRCPGRRHRSGCLRDWQTQELRATRSRKIGRELSFEDTSRRKLAVARKQDILLKRRQVPFTLFNYQFRFLPDRR